MKYYIAAGHVPGAGAHGQGLEEGRVAVQVADALVATLNAVRSGLAVLVPDNLDLAPAIKWVNEHAATGDRALELHLNAAGPAAHGCLVATTKSSHNWAAPLIGGLTNVGIVPWGAGVYDEAAIAHMRGWHHLGWCNDIDASSALLEMGFITNKSDASHFANAALRKALVGELAAALGGEFL